MGLFLPSKFDWRTDFALHQLRGTVLTIHDTTIHLKYTNTTVYGTCRPVAAASDSRYSNWMSTYEARLAQVKQLIAEPLFQRLGREDELVARWRRPRAFSNWVTTTEERLATFFTMICSVATMAEHRAAPPVRAHSRPGATPSGVCTQQLN